MIIEMKTYYSLSLPSLIEISWYSCLVLATSSGQPSVLSWLAATLEAKVSPGKVTTGVPVQSTSILVVCPLQSGVSRQTSANCPRRTCSSLAATLLKIMRPGCSPSCWTVCWRLGSPTVGNRSNQRTLLGTFLRICNLKILALMFINPKIYFLLYTVSKQYLRKPTYVAWVDQFCRADWNCSTQQRLRVIRTAALWW